MPNGTSIYLLFKIYKVKKLYFENFKYNISYKNNFLIIINLNKNLKINPFYYSGYVHMRENVINFF